MGKTRLNSMNHDKSHTQVVKMKFLLLPLDSQMNTARGNHTTFGFCNDSLNSVKFIQRKPYQT